MEVTQPRPLVTVDILAVLTLATISVLLLLSLVAGRVVMVAATAVRPGKPAFDEHVLLVWNHGVDWSSLIRSRTLCSYRSLHFLLLLLTKKFR